MSDHITHNIHGPQDRKVLVVGPYTALGGMASAMQIQMHGALCRHYRLIPIDNSKRTRPDRSLFEAIQAQLALLCELVRTVRLQRPKLIHIHTCSGFTFFRSSLDLLVAKLFRVPALLHIHGGRFAEFVEEVLPWQRWLVRRVLRWADRVVALSPQWADRILHLESRARAVVVHNGVTIPQYTRRHRTHGAITVVFVGTLKCEKGVDDLIESVSELPRKFHSSLKVDVIGPDPTHRRSEISKRIDERKLSKVVRLCGAYTPDQVRRALESASIFVLPSHHEGLPIALLEAMAHGLPAVVTRVGAIPEVVRHGVEGLLVPPRDPHRLSCCLARLLKNSGLRCAMGRAARRRVRWHFSAGTMTRELDEVYRTLLSPMERILHA